MIARILVALALLFVSEAHAQTGQLYFRPGPCQSGEVADGSLCFGAGSPPGGFHYYLNPSLGSDANDGLSQATPWKTIAHALAQQFKKDDHIFVLAGSTVTGCGALDWTLGGNVSGTSASDPIVIDIYGGTAPFTWQADGTCATADGSALLRLNAPNGITINNAKFVGNAGTPSRGISLENSGSTQAPGAVSLNNIETIGFWDGASTNFGAHVFYQGYPGGGIGTVTINGWKCHGASVTSSDDGCLNGYGNGINLGSLDISNFAGWDIGGRTNAARGQSGNCLESNGVSSFHVHQAVCHDVSANINACGASFGIWAANTTTALFEDIEVYNVHQIGITGGCDRGGVDFDIGVANGTVRNSYIHDNDGECVLVYDNGNHHIVTENVICENNATTYAAQMFWQFGSASSSWQLVNNTIRGAGKAIGSQGSGACPASWLVANNLIDVTQGANGLNYFVYIDRLCSSSETWTHNGYFGDQTGNRPLFRIDGGGAIYQSYAAWQAAVPGGDAGAVLGVNPQFVGPLDATCTSEASATLGPQPCPAGYALAAGSPYLGAGFDVTQAPWSMSLTADYFGSAEAAPFNIGAY